MKIFLALVKKEIFQILRDTSSIVIAFVLPLISILIYMYGINLDTPKTTIGIKCDDNSPEVQTLIKSFSQSKYINTFVYNSDKELRDNIIASKVRGGVYIPNDFSTKLSRKQNASVLIVTDGTEVNTANYVQNYSMQILNNWLATSKYNSVMKKSVVTPEIRMWFNQDINSHNFILPGSIPVTMSLIGILLTALVIAREWERGTMETLLSTQVKKIHIVLGKYVPYFILGMLSLAFNVFMCVAIFQVPFRGNYFVLFIISSLFLFTCLGVGLLISTKLKNQFLASQVSLALGFMPALMLSGLMFPVNSMPKIFQYLSLVLPPRHFVTFLESEFMAGTIPEVVFINAAFLIILGLILFVAVYENTQMRLNK